MKRKETLEIVVDGKKITLRDLVAVIPPTQALIVIKLLYYTFARKFIVCDDDGNIYVRKSLTEWVNELVLCYETTGRKKKVSKSCACTSFGTLVKNGIIRKRVATGSRIVSYMIIVNEVKKCLDI